MYCIDATSLCICVKNIIFILIIIELNKIYWRRCYWKRKVWERSAIIANSPNSLFLFSPSANMLQVTACEHQYRELLWSLMLAWTSKFLSGAKLSDRSACWSLRRAVCSRQFWGLVSYRQHLVIRYREILISNSHSL